jgi:hypothetical protein
LWLLVLLAGRYRDRPLALGYLAAAWLLLTLTLAGRPDMIIASGILTTLETVAGLILGFAVLRLGGVERGAERVSAARGTTPAVASAAGR